MVPYGVISRAPDDSAMSGSPPTRHPQLEPVNPSPRACSTRGEKFGLVLASRGGPILASVEEQLTKDIKKVGSVVLKSAPGGEMVLEALDVAVRRRRNKEFSRLITNLVWATKMQDEAELASLIEQHGDEDWCVQGLEEGLRTVMSSVDEIAKKCALLMVADYLERHDVPDRVYRQFASLFSEVDAPVLKAIRAISSAAGEGGGVFVGFLALNYNKKGTYKSVCLGKKPVELNGDVSEEAFFVACAALQRNCLAAVWNGAVLSGVRDESLELDKFANSSIRMQVEAYQRPLWARLHGYLAPVSESYGKPVT